MPPREDGGWPPAGPHQRHCYPTWYMLLPISDVKVSLCQAWDGEFTFLTNIPIPHEVCTYIWIDSSSLFYSNPSSKLQSEGLSETQIWPRHPPALSMIPHCPEIIFLERNEQTKPKMDRSYPVYFHGMTSSSFKYFIVIHPTNIIAGYF